MNEKWADITSYEGLYQISNHGKVRSLNRVCGRRKVKGQMMKLITHTRGYQAIWLRSEGDHKKFFVHRLVAIHFLPKLDHQDQVNHKDKNRLHNHVLNLEWCTWEENYKHRDAVINNDEPF